MSEALFRKEVLEARRTGWLGSIAIAQPQSLSLLAAAAFVIAAFIVLFLVLASYTWRSTVSGQLLPSAGMVAVLSPATGVISQLLVTEGDDATVDQRLAIVTVPKATVTGGNAAQAIAWNVEERREGLLSAHAAQERTASVREAGLAGQLRVTRSELGQLQVEIDTRQSQIRIARETLDRLRKLEDQRYVSLLQIKEQESTWLEHTATMQAMQRQAIAMRRTIVQLQQEIDELPGSRLMQESTLRVDLALLAQDAVENEARGALVVSTPVAGIIANQLVELGQSVLAGQPILNLLPAGSALEANLLVPSRAIGFIAEGNRVQLRYQAFPYQKFGHQTGIVTRVGRNALSGNELGALADAVHASGPFYRVTVSLNSQTVMAYGKREALKPGMLLEADVLGERRRLIEWVFEPLYALKGRLVSS